MSFAEWGTTTAAVVGGVLAIWGIVRLLGSARIAALKLFSASILVAILFGQFFAFATEQFYALGSLTWELLMLGVVRFALSREQERDDLDQTGQDTLAAGAPRLQA